ncbi:MAG: PstS family phosphate ABC transporter substrate-binding protein [Cyanothece sp. SIO1E1]|nr:PstS family phosphate ABC transporter substrate-binding protein [Cyanothece sp. SIO1E1]
MSFRSFDMRRACSLSLVTLLATLTACGGSTDTATTTTDDAASAPAESGLTGDVSINGSSTVFLISEAMAEEFKGVHPNVRVTVGVSGSGGGFKKFCGGETDISNASRPIKQSEIDLCEKAGIEFVELPIAFDGLSVVVNNDNDWATCLTVEELGRMWEPAAEKAVNNWSQINKEFPDRPLTLYGPGIDSGTYDYFREATLPKEVEGTRGDYTATEDDNIIVQGVRSDPGGLGFFGFAYYEENKETLKVVPIKNAEGECVEPNSETIESGIYNPLSRPIFFYVKTSSLDNPAVAAFVQYQTDAANGNLISDVGYVPLPGDILEKVHDRLDGAVTGSIFGGGTSVGVKLSEKL